MTTMMLQMIDDANSDNADAVGYAADDADGDVNEADDAVVIGVDVAVIVAIADAIARISLASAWEIRAPLVSITITCIEMKKICSSKHSIS